MFDIADHLDELRCWPTDRLEAQHRHLLREQRRLHLEDLDVLRILDERGRVDTTVGNDGESPGRVKENVETARRLESLPNIAAAAHAGKLSDEQLTSVVKLADEESDAEWAARAPQVPPGDLARLARATAKPAVDDSRRRHEARSLRMWWTPDEGMLHLRGELPDVMGAAFEATILRLAEQRKPSRGQAWDSFEHRAADSLLQLCEGPGTENHAPTSTAKPVLLVQVPLSGPAEIAGVPIADELVEQLRANASIEPVLVDDDGIPVAAGRRFSALSPKSVRAVLLRDGHCRVPGCEVRRGLEVHHLRPRSWGGGDEIVNLAAVCPSHHRTLVPHGPHALIGNPNRPDGLERVRLDDLTPQQRRQVGLPALRAGPNAA